MPLAAPKLDDRHFQDIVDEAKKRIPYYIKEWTDHNVSDPGVTMIELFAWMTDIILYRLNQVPDKHYIKFMEMLGLTLKEPVPARAPVTFWLSAPQEARTLIPAGTEVASTQTETQPSIVFTTNEDFYIDPPRLGALYCETAAENGERDYQSHEARRLLRGLESLSVFSKQPQEGDAFYLGFENDLSHAILGLELDCDPSGGAGIDPTLPPYIWEASTGSLDEPWLPCGMDLGEDTTKGMNTSGRIRIHLPAMGKQAINKDNFYWVRVRLLFKHEYEDRMRPYRTTPRLRQATLTTWGGTTQATHAEQIEKELLGTSDGSAGQIFHLQVTPILKRRPGETLAVEINGDVERWTEVANFAASGPEDHHFTLDALTGELRLGPAVRQRDGAIRRYGAVPPRGARLVFQRYRYGGGLEGNVQVGVLNTLKTAIPYIARVSNRAAAEDGLEAETLEALMMRAPALLRSRDRAVTEADFEFLAREALRDTGWSEYRVKCLQPVPSRESRLIPGQVYVLIIPHIPDPAVRLRPRQEDLELKRDGTFDILSDYLNERRLLTMRLDIREPVYRWAAARVTVHTMPGANHGKVEEMVQERLYHFLNPLIGGPDGRGWPFGRGLVASDIYQCLQGVAGLQYIRGVELFVTSAGQGPRGEPIDVVDVVGHGTIASGIHEVVFA